MRALIVVIIMISFVLGGWIYIYNTLNDICTQFTHTLNQVHENINSKNWVNATNQLKSIEKKWKNIHTRLALFIDHEEIHTVNISIVKAKKYAQVKNTPLALAEIEVLKELFSFIREDEMLTLRNIL